MLEIASRFVTAHPQFWTRALAAFLGKVELFCGSGGVTYVNQSGDTAGFRKLFASGVEHVAAKRLALPDLRHVPTLHRVRGR